MERIEITDSGLIVRVGKIVEDLRKFYPDGAVYSLGKLHKGLSNRVGETWRAIGYETREDFLVAYGFTVGNSKGGGGIASGRPTLATAEAAEELFEELLVRYEGREKPKTLEILSHDNPDLAGRMKSYANKSQELFGMTWGKVLQDRGLLAEKKAVTAADALERKNKIEAMIEDLRECYENAPERPSTVKALKLEHPEYVEELNLLAKVSDRLYGSTMANHLKSVGVLKMSASAIIPAEEVDAILDDLVSRFGRYVNDDKPSSWNALIDSASDIGNEIKAARKTWEKANGGKFVDELKRLGVMKMSFAEQRRFLVRNASSIDLAKIWRRGSGPNEIDSDDELGTLLPNGIAAINFDDHLQLEEFIICFSASDCPQELLYAPLPNDLSYSAEMYRLYIKTPNGKTLLKKDVSLTEEFEEIEKAANSREEGHTLKARVHAEVVSVTRLSPGLLAGSNPVLVQVRLFKAMPLEARTILHVLCKSGFITATDLMVGAEWLTRDYSETPIGRQADPADDDGLDKSVDSTAAKDPDATERQGSAEEAGGAGPAPDQSSKRDDIRFGVTSLTKKAGSFGFSFGVSSK